jgi:hypothetical protein
VIEEINYCIKMISSNKLYEVNIDLELGEEHNGNKDVIALYN